jgi:hypothetical protein
MAQQYWKVTIPLEIILPARNDGDADSQVMDSTITFVLDQIERGLWVGRLAPDPNSIRVEHVPRDSIKDELRRMAVDPDAFAPDIPRSDETPDVAAAGDVVRLDPEQQLSPIKTRDDLERFLSGEKPDL